MKQYHVSPCKINNIKQSVTTVITHRRINTWKEIKHYHWLHFTSDTVAQCANPCPDDDFETIRTRHCFIIWPLQRRWCHKHAQISYVSSHWAHKAHCKEKKTHKIQRLKEQGEKNCRTRCHMKIETLFQCTGFGLIALQMYSIEL